MEILIDDIRKQCFSALSNAGATREQCNFYADAIRCEYESIYVTHRLLADVRNEAGKSPLDINLLVEYFLKLLKHFKTWCGEVKSLASRKGVIKPLRVDTRAKAASELKQALCSLQTKDVSLMEGDEYRIVDSSKPNKLKVVTSRGEEGYIPSMATVFPTPDNNAGHAVERLQIHLLACWTDSEAKLRPLVHRAINVSADIMSKHWTSYGPLRRHEVILGDEVSWESRVSRRVRRVGEIARGPTHQVDLNRLRKTFCSLENELLWQRNEKLSSLIEAVASVDRLVLAYQAFRKQWREYRLALRENIPAINMMVNWDSRAFQDRSKSLRYYEVKLTAEETVTNEEATYQLPKEEKETKSEWSDEYTITTSGESLRESVAAEQITQRSHEENKRFIIRSVIDPRSKEEISVQSAVSDGIIDHKAGIFKNPRTGERKSLAIAMQDGSIKVEYVTTTRTPEKVESIGLITIKTQVDNRGYIITGIIDSTTGQRVDMTTARKKGLINEVAGYYVDGRNGKHLLLDDAIDSGWIEVEYEKENPAGFHYETKAYAVRAVVDQRLRKAVPFIDAIRHGLIEKDSGNYVNNVTGEKVFAAEAIRRGFFKSMVVENPSELNIDATNRLVVERIDKVRKNVLRGVKVLAAFNHALTNKDKAQRGQSPSK